MRVLFICLHSAIFWTKHFSSYPLDNCNGSTHYNPQDFISSLYLNHTFTQTQNSAYINTTQIAANLGKPVLLFETNTASCGGFSGLSDSFLSALWAVDYSLNMACGNISNTLFHVGGQSNYYNVRHPLGLAFLTCILATSGRDHVDHIFFSYTSFHINVLSSHKLTWHTLTLGTFVFNKHFLAFHTSRDEPVTRSPMDDWTDFLLITCRCGILWQIRTGTSC